MSAAGIRKAASLLMNLPPSTAAELLKSVKPETMTRIVAELAYLQQNAGTAGGSDHVQEFYTLVSKRRARPESGGLAKLLLENTLGAVKAQETMQQVQELLRARDPFQAIRAIPVAALAKAIEGEAPQIVTMLLSELSPAKSSQLLGMLTEDARIQAVQCMAAGMTTSPEVKVKVASMITSRLGSEEVQAAVASTGTDPRQEQLRKVAVLLRTLDKTLRETLVGAINSQDAEAAKAIRTLMVTWEDLVLIGDRSLQEVLRTVDTRKLALALIKADGAIVKKVRSNISERAGAMVDEETSLMSSPKPADTLASRETILEALRALNNKGELPFVQEEQT